MRGAYLMAFVSVEQERVLQDVLAERERQDEKWGSQRHLSGDRWNTILTEEVGEAAKEVLEENTDKLRAELVQVAAVAVAWLEALDANQ